MRAPPSPCLGLAGVGRWWVKKQQLEAPSPDALSPVAPALPQHGHRQLCKSTCLLFQQQGTGLGGWAHSPL